jgi:DNA-directed RNA polymerase subunit RPC12/RpoP
MIEEPGATALSSPSCAAEVEKLAAVCARCGFSFILEIPIRVPLQISVAALNDGKCPECGGKKLLL